MPVAVVAVVDLVVVAGDPPRRMIWLIGATSFGHASMQLKQCVQS